jgi:hypothetical protein
MPDTKIVEPRQYYYTSLVLKRERLSLDQSSQLDLYMNDLAAEGWVLDHCSPLDRGIIMVFRLSAKNISAMPALPSRPRGTF